MTVKTRNSVTVQSNEVKIETYVDGEGKPLVLLPSYGRDGGEDYDDLTSRLVVEGWKVLRPQPRGIAGSTGPMANQSLHDLAGDVALCIRHLCTGPVVLLGHAFGNILARVVTTDFPELVTAAILAAAEASKVPEEVSKTPFIAGDLAAPESKRLDALGKAFFAPNHDPTIWLKGWYPATLKMQHEAAKRTGLQESWGCGNVPLLQLIGDYDPFNPKPYWNEMHDQFGDRVTVRVVKDASHALFPEQPALVADAILPWADKHKA